MGDISAMAEMVAVVFAADTDYKRRVELSRNLLHELKTKKWRSIQAPLVPEEEGLFPLSLIAKTRRGYLITVCRQMNGCFGSGWPSRSQKGRAGFFPTGKRKRNGVIG